MDMDSAQMEAGKRKVVEQYGEWTAHNVHLRDELYTMGNFIRGDEILLRRIIQIASDVTDRPLQTLRVLDLACLEGLYAIEFARHGASALGIEAREANLQKARFVKEVLKLDKLDLVQDDVRNLSSERYGMFDVVLCLGILYHLDAPDVFEFVHQMSQVCTRCLILDTHISCAAQVQVSHGSHQYSGHFYTEHQKSATPEEKEKNLWASIDNLKSFWPTRPSLYNLLAHAGFTSVFECHNPPQAAKPADRVTLLAIKGSPQAVISAPLLSSEVEDWSNEQTHTPYSGFGRIGPALGRRLRTLVRRLSGPRARH